MTDLGILRRQEIGGVSIEAARSCEAHHLNPYVEAAKLTRERTDSR